MIGNIIGIVVIICALIGVFIYYKVQLSKDIEEEEYISQFSISHLIDEIAKVFSESQKENLTELNLTKRELESRQNDKRLLRQNLKNASFGDPSAKKYIKSLIKSIIQDEVYGINPETINSVIPFNQPGHLTTRDKLDILFHNFYKEYGTDGFEELVNRYGLTEAKEISMIEEIKGAIKYDITADDIDAVYEDASSLYPLSYDDKLEIVTQRIFADYKGFGIIDMLFDFAIDEIQGGMSGYAKGFLEAKSKVAEEIHYTYESIWIVYKGRNIKLSCMTFGSQEELIRVSKNIYKFQTSHALSRNEGHVVATMRDGSRVAVTRPPECDSWAFCARKFDTVGKAPTIPELFPPSIQHNSEIVEAVLMYLTYGMFSMIVTGGMGDGKTTTLRTIVGFIPSEKAIRIYELAPELNAQASFENRNIKAFAATETTTLQDLYNFGKKFSANVSIVSEIASAEGGVIAIESGRVGSEMLLSTHHATSTDNLISAITDNMTSAGGYSDEKAAEEVVVHVINFDIHMARVGGMRYIERISEVRPVVDRRYPSQINNSLEVAGKEDTREYYARQTDRKSYEVVDIVRFSLEDYSYHMVNRLSDEHYNRLYNKLLGQTRDNFVKDFETLYSMIGH